MPESKTPETEVQRIVRLEEEAERERSLADRIAETIGRFAGTVWFVVSAIVFAGVWIFLNVGPEAWDPYPFHLLGGILAFLALTLTSFVLIHDNRMSARADRRNHLALQVNLLSEQEGTKIIQMLERMSRALDIEGQVVDRDSHRLGSDTSIEEIAEELKENIDETTGELKKKEDAADEQAEQPRAPARMESEPGPAEPRPSR